MKTLYLDLGMGAAGDMLTAALFELMPARARALEQLNGLGLPGVVFRPEDSTKCGIRGTHMRVLVHGEEEGVTPHHDHCEQHTHHHSSMADIQSLVDGLHVSQIVKGNVMAVYEKIAQAESHVHGVPVTEIHFHEVGALDALADITAVCFLLEQLSPEKIVASPDRKSVV